MLRPGVRIEENLTRARISSAVACAAVVWLTGCTTSTKPDDPTLPPVVTLADHTTPLCTPTPLTGTLPAGTADTDATLTLQGRPSDLTLEPTSDGAFAIDPSDLPLDDVCTPTQAPCTLDADLTVRIDGDLVSTSATLFLTDQGLLSAYVDSDGDSYGDDGTDPQLVCSLTGHTDRQGDCDDGDATIKPDAQDVPNNDTDDNCDSLWTCFEDLDDDGFGTATLVDIDTPCSMAANGGSTEDNDCNDLVGTGSDYQPGPGARVEGVGDPDFNCDSSVICTLDFDEDGFGNDQGATQPSPVALGGPSNCGSTYRTAANATDCDDMVGAINPAVPETAGNDVDENCDQQQLCYADGDVDGFFSDTDSLTPVGDTCTTSGWATFAGTDCNDGSNQVFPGSTFGVCDGADNDCADGDEFVLHTGSTTAVYPGVDPEDQLTAALASPTLADGDTLQLCSGQTYLGSFTITEPIILDGDGATLDGNHETNDWTTCPTDGPHRVLLVDGTAFGGGTAKLRDLTIEDGCVNTSNADSRGGGVDVVGGASLAMDTVFLDDNHAEFGGGIAVRGGSTVIWDIGGAQAHTARRGAGAWVEFGSSLEANGNAGSMDFEWFANTAANDGGSIYSGGDLVLSECDFSFSNATTGDGGAIFASGATTTLSACAVDGSAGRDGGAIFASGATTTLSVASLSGTASSFGDAIYVASDTNHDEGSLAGDGGSAARAAYVAPGANYDFTCVENSDGDNNITIPLGSPNDFFFGNYRNGVTECTASDCTELPPPKGEPACP